MLESTSNFAAIREWKEAGAELSNSLSKYLDLCSSLKTTSLQEGVRALDLANRVDSVLRTLHAKLDQQLALSRAALSRTRNELISPLHHLPEELLSEIFMNIVFGDDVWEDPDGFGPCSMEGSLSAMRQHLYRLLHVCSTWRNVILARDIFWSTVGTYRVWASSHGSFLSRTNVNLHIRKSEGVNLHLVVALPLAEDFELDGLREHASQFRTINIESEYNGPSSSVKNVIDIFLKNRPSSLSELSISHVTSESYATHILPEEMHIVHYNSSDWVSFLAIVKSLSVLRIKGATLSWRHMAFSNRLVELRLQTITIGHDSEFAVFLGVLSSAPELRDIKLISVVTLSDQATPWRTIPGQQHVILPKLKSLLLEDLYFNTLESLFRWLVLGSCQLTLYLTDHSRETASSNSEPEPVDIENLYSLLRTITVATLVLSESQLLRNMLHGLLESMPTLKNLKMHLWECDPIGRDALKWPGPQATWSELADGVSFPKLEQLYLSSLRMGDDNDEVLKEVVASHSIQKMVLGDLIYREEGGVIVHKRLDGNEAICVWLRSNVPDFLNLLGTTRSCSPLTLE
ncbi:hypothetical protein OPQ81_005553 [Rhizoctonia solani]|nr:hypothetical protein OPQ81_005553 [Rhizoctonia solani]